MMSKLDQQLREDKLLRDAAKTLFNADLDRVKGDLETRGVGKRALGRVKDGASELLDSASDKAGNNIGVIAVLFGAIAIWFARNPILSLFGSEEDESAEQSPNTDTPIGDEP